MHARNAQEAILVGYNNLFIKQQDLPTSERYSDAVSK